MNEQKLNKPNKNNGLARELIMFGITGLIALGVTIILGLGGTLEKLIALVVPLLAGLLMQYWEWFRRKGVYASIISVLLISSIVLNILLVIDRFNNEPNDKALSIDAIPSWVIPYQGRDDEEGGLGSSWLNIEYTESGHPNYQFRCELPVEEYGYAGLIFKFSRPQDLTSYRAVEIKAKFEKKVETDFYIVDIDGRKKAVRIGDGITSGGDITVNVSEGIQTTTIPLHNNFGSIRLEVVDEVEFFVDTGLARGHNNFTIQSVRFIKD